MSKKNRGVTVTPNGDAVYTPSDDGSTPPVVTESNGKKPVISKRERFMKHAERRVGKAVKALGRVKNLGNKASYEYSEEEATIILDVLDSAVKDVRSAFTGTTEKCVSFKLF